MPVVRHLEASDCEAIARAFAQLGWNNKPATLYRRYLVEQQAGTRVVLVAIESEQFLGYATVLWESSYGPFRGAAIPEISDLTVLPSQHRRGVGSLLLDQAETTVAARSSVVGIGMGLHSGYGAAQRLYVSRGYVPDGRGVTWRGRHVAEGESVVVDDDLVVWMTRRLPRS